MKRSLFPVLALALAAGGCDLPAGGMEPEPGQQVRVNEALAVAHLRAIASAQVLAQNLCVIDTDVDGVGEFAFLSELSGARAPRGAGSGLKAPLLGDGYRKFAAGGCILEDGYLYRVYLPGARGAPVGEGRGEADSVSPDDAETEWICYAWPERPGESGERAFVVSSAGEVRARKGAAYGGGKAPDALAALRDGETIGGEFRPEWIEVD